MSELMRSYMNNGCYPSHTDTGGKGGKGGCRDVINKAEVMLNLMISRHSKVLVAAMTLCYQDGSDVLFPFDNGHICGLVQGLTRYYTGKGCENKYIWVRESSPTGQSQYHLVFLINGNLIWNVTGLLKEARERWSWLLSVDNAYGLVCLARPRMREFGEAGEVADPHGGIIIERNSPEFQDNCNVYSSWASFLSECYGRGWKPSSVRGFGSSELPPSFRPEAWCSFF